MSGLKEKGYAFMPFEERAEILSAIKGVAGVIEASDEDDTVCQTLKDLQPTFLQTEAIGKRKYT